MKLFDHIAGVFDDAQAGKFESALLHACVAIDATAKRLYPSERKVGRRYVRCIRQYYWLIEPMLGVGLNLVETKFQNITLSNDNNSPDLADIIYEIFRCRHVHGEEIPIEFETTKAFGWLSSWKLGANKLRMPDRILWALTAVVVLSKANYGVKGGGSCHLLLGGESYFISEWWGREGDFRPIAARWNTFRLKLEGLERLRDSSSLESDVDLLRMILVPPRP